MSYRFIAESKPIAKKAHRCTWCGQAINAGERYIRRRGVFEGDPQTDKLHPECDEAADAFCREWDDGYTMYDNERPPVEHHPV